MSEKEKTKEELEAEAKEAERKAKEDRDITVHFVHEKGKGWEKEKDPKNPEGTGSKEDDPKGGTPAKTPEEIEAEAAKKKEKDAKNPEKDGKKTISMEEYEKLRKEKEDYEAILQLQATQEFDKQKAEFLATIPDEKKREKVEAEIGDKPEILMEYKRIAEFMPIVPEKKEGSTDGGAGEGETDDKKGKDGKPPEKTEEEKFADEVEEFLSQVDEDKRDEIRKSIKTKEQLANVKLWTDILSSAVRAGGGTVTGGAPAGKATIPPSKVKEGYKDIIDNLYAIKRDPSKTRTQQKAADDMIQELFGELFRGLKESGKVANWQMMKCPRCGELLLGSRGTAGRLSPTLKECPSCGWKPETYIDPRAKGR